MNVSSLSVWSSLLFCVGVEEIVILVTMAEEEKWESFFRAPYVCAVYSWLLVWHHSLIPLQEG